MNFLTICTQEINCKKMSAYEKLRSAECLSENEKNVSTKKNKYVWNDICFDHHFGIDISDSTREPYNNRGRTKEVWKTLNAYGFRQSSDNQSFEGLTPSARFENFVRKRVKNAKNVHNDGQLVGFSIAKLLSEIRSSHYMNYLDDASKKPSKRRMARSWSN